MIVLSRATTADAQAIASLERACIECPWSEQNIAFALDEPRYEFVKAEDGGTLAGYIGVEWLDGEGNIQNLAVESGLRRRGVGSALVAEVIARADERKAKLFLEVNVANAAAIALYRKFGFAALYERKRYYGERSALVMTRDPR